MIAIATNGTRVRAALPLTPAQEEMTVAEYEARRCRRCGVSAPTDDENAPKLYATPEGPICALDVTRDELAVEVIS